MDKQNTETPIQKVAYWPNGLWCDPETAELAVEVGDFPADYKTVEFAADADQAFIEDKIAALVNDSLSVENAAKTR